MAKGKLNTFSAAKENRRRTRREELVELVMDHHRSTLLLLKYRADRHSERRKTPSASTHVLVGGPCDPLCEIRQGEQSLEAGVFVAWFKLHVSCKLHQETQ